jgi:hypothetical protein
MTNLLSCDSAYVVDELEILFTIHTLQEVACSFCNPVINAYMWMEIATSPEE